MPNPIALKFICGLAVIFLMGCSCPQSLPSEPMAINSNIASNLVFSYAKNEAINDFNSLYLLTIFFIASNYDRSQVFVTHQPGLDAAILGNPLSVELSNFTATIDLYIPVCFGGN